MADSDSSPELKGRTVAICANQCQESFQQCLISASSVHPRLVSMVEDQLARFSSWATSIGVFALGSASMDHRLRYASEVQSVVTGLLESLNYRVQTCSKALAQLAESSSPDVSTTTNDPLGQSFLDIAAEITRLNKISNIIRRASKDTQVLKASNFQIKDEEGENVEPLLLSHFEHHIGDWFPGISETIRQRLARAMLLRRKRILYRRHRQGNTSIRAENTISQVSVTLPDTQPKAGSSLQATSKQKDQKAAVNRPAAKVAPSQVKSATTLVPEKFKMVSSSPSVVSASRTIASGKHQVLTYPPAPGFAAKRRYEKLKSQRMVEAAEKRTEPSLQELLESDLRAIGEITCPYCLYALPAAEVFDERKWQNHVKNDLDPYVCLFEDCDQPDVLYTHSDEWLGHLHQHGKVWRCSSHREMGPFSTLEDYMKHMREVHDTKLSDRQLRMVANRNTRKTSKLFPLCPLCGREESEVDGRLQDHLTGHLRSLALKSLPSYQDEIPDDVGDGNNSIGGSRPRSRSTLREMEEEKEEMPQDGAGNFSDHWTPQLAQGISVNFLGDVYLELDLGDSKARDASLFFDTMVFKESPENLDHDPILDSMRQQQLARIEVINSGTGDSSDLSVEQEVANSSKLPVGETYGQDEVDGTLTQQPIDAEAAHAQAATLRQDTEVDHPKVDQTPDTLAEPGTQAPPATKLEIPADTRSANLSNVPMNETYRQDEGDDPATQGPARVDTVHAQTATVKKDVRVIFQIHETVVFQIRETGAIDRLKEGRYDQFPLQQTQALTNNILASNVLGNGFNVLGNSFFSRGVTPGTLDADILLVSKLAPFRNESFALEAGVLACFHAFSHEGARGQVREALGRCEIPGPFFLHQARAYLQFLILASGIRHEFVPNEVPVLAKALFNLVKEREPEEPFPAILGHLHHIGKESIDDYLPLHLVEMMLCYADYKEKLRIKLNELKDSCQWHSAYKLVAGASQLAFLPAKALLRYALPDRNWWMPWQPNLDRIREWETRLSEKDRYRLVEILDLEGPDTTGGQQRPLLRHSCCGIFSPAADALPLKNGRHIMDSLIAVVDRAIARGSEAIGLIVTMCIKPRRVDWQTIERIEAVLALRSPDGIRVLNTYVRAFEKGDLSDKVQACTAFLNTVTAAPQLRNLYGSPRDLAGPGCHVFMEAVEYLYGQLYERQASERFALATGGLGRALASAEWLHEHWGDVFVEGLKGVPSDHYISNAFNLLRTASEVEYPIHRDDLAYRLCLSKREDAAAADVTRPSRLGDDLIRSIALDTDRGLLRDKLCREIREGFSSDEAMACVNQSKKEHPSFVKKIHELITQENNDMLCVNMAWYLSRNHNIPNIKRPAECWRQLLMHKMRQRSPGLLERVGDALPTSKLWVDWQTHLHWLYQDRHYDPEGGLGFTPEKFNAVTVQKMGIGRSVTMSTSSTGSLGRYPYSGRDFGRD